VGGIALEACLQFIVIFLLLKRLKAIIQVKLLPDAAQQESLLSTMRTFNAACDWLAERAVELGVFTHFKLQSACYKSIRSLFGLSAQAACLVCAKVADAYAISKTQRTFSPTGAIIYDLRLLSWNLDKSLISIWALPKRLSIPFICGDKQRELLSYPRGQSDLIYRDGQFFLHVTIDIPDVEEKAVMDLIGVDLGVACIAFDSDGNSYSGKQINKVRHRNKALREKLQKKGTKSAKRLLRKRRRKERRFAADSNHVISKRIVTLAQRTERGIALEELDGIRDRIRAKKDQRYRLHSWSFAQLGSFITYKAKRCGVPVVFVDPKHTSQQCNRCLHTERANRRSRDLFVCKVCGHTEHADGNGAKNILLRGLEILGSADVIPPNAEVISSCQIT
jgi:putative transposase